MDLYTSNLLFNMYINCNENKLNYYSKVELGRIMISGNNIFYRNKCIFELYCHNTQSSSTLLFNVTYKHLVNH
jgi:hypothetical protein